MPAPPDIYGALVDHVRSEPDFDCWLNREPEQTTATARKLPYVVLEGAFTTDWNFEKSVTDTGTVTFYCLAVGDNAARTMGEAIKDLFADPEDWRNILIDGQQVVEVSRSGFALRTEEQPDRVGNIVYRYEITFHVVVSGVS